jgi:hypothetical protein
LGAPGLSSLTRYSRVRNDSDRVEVAIRLVIPNGFS